MSGELSTVAVGMLGTLGELLAGDGVATVPSVLADTGYGRFVGRMHPIAVHFPIALLIVAAIVELCRLPFSKATRPSHFGLVAVLFAACFASWAAASGWLNADFESHEETRTLALHRWLGVGVAAITIVIGLAAIVAAMVKDPAASSGGSPASQGPGDGRGTDAHPPMTESVGASGRASGSRAAAEADGGSGPGATGPAATAPMPGHDRPADSGSAGPGPAARPRRAFAIYRYGVLTAGLLVAFTGHLGGELVYGEGYLMKAWPSNPEPDDDVATPEPAEGIEADPSSTGEVPPASADPATSGSEKSPDESSGDTSSGDNSSGDNSSGDNAADDRDDKVDAPPAGSESTSGVSAASDDSGGSGESDAGDGGGAEGEGGASAETFEKDERAAAVADPRLFFATAVLPPMQARCVECHGPDKAKAGLRLDSFEATIAGDEFDRVVVPGDPAESILLQRVVLPRDHIDAMPPKGEGMTDAEIDALRAWIAALPAG